MKFFLKILLLSLLVLASVWFLMRRGEVVYTDYNYLASLIDKNHLLETVEPPRLIFVGASNVAFGIDSKKIEEELKIPAINMGLHGGLGLDFILNNVKQNIKKGDIVILAIEYYLDEIEYAMISYVTNLYPKAKEFVEYDTHYYLEKLKFEFSKAQLARKRLFNSLFSKVFKFKEARVIAESDFNQFDTTIYSRKKFNLNGDEVGHLDKPPLKKIRGGIPIESKDYSKCIDKLNEFAKYVEYRGAKVYFTYPSYPESEFKKYHKSIMHFDDQLRDELKIPIISTLEDFIYPDSLFFDTVYHLNKEGREMRKDKTIKILKEKVLNKEK